MQGKCGHGTLVAHIEDDLIVDVDGVVEPLYLRGHQRGVAQLQQQEITLGIEFLVVTIEIMTTRVGKLEGALIGAVDIGEIG